MALAGADGRLLAEDKRPTLAHEGPDGVLRRIADSIEGLAVGLGCRPDAIGIGIPGLVDREKGETRFLPNLPTQWRDVPVSEILGNRFGCTVHLLNDARAAALGESRFGHGKRVGTMILFTLGTGIGGGVVIDGTLRLGPFGAAGEIGHICVEPGGLLCGCGARGCLETVASGPALTAEGVRMALGGHAPKLYRLCGGDIAKISPQLLGQAALAGDPGARAILDRAGDLLGMASSAVVLALHPELIVLAEAWPAWEICSSSRCAVPWSRVCGCSRLEACGSSARCSATGRESMAAWPPPWTPSTLRGDPPAGKPRGRRAAVRKKGGRG